VPQVGIINPSEFQPANSIEMVIWVAAGGRATLVGAAFGGVLINYMKTIFTTGLLAPYWLFALGGVFILVTVFMPKGVLGFLSSLKIKQAKEEELDPSLEAQSPSQPAK
jgi:urea transport system permease protein